MHKKIPVVDMRIDETGYIVELRDIYDIRHLPPGVDSHKAAIDCKSLNDWWLGRSIPASRDGINEALQSIGILLPSLLLEKCYGLSLSDQYWICPKDSGLSWEKVNFFFNDFSQDMGEILFGREPQNPGRISLMSPDNTSDGWLRKKWIIAGGKRFLLKGGSGYMQQEPFNEVIASSIMRRLGIKHVAYTLFFDGEKPYSLCENFVSPDTELIPAWRVLQTLKQPSNRSLIDHFFDCCEALGLTDAKDSLFKLLTMDYIIANEDRHWNNFGLMRNAETLKWLGFAPVYDSGTSLWYNTPHVGQDLICKPFSKTHAEQIKLVKDFSWFDYSTLKGLSLEITDILTPSDRVDEKRREAITLAVEKRCSRIEKLAEGKPE
ncbi:MAG: HipA domain-containing protein [Clostridiales bacterium]|jgi:hypothetical protein|nr:HipA domain-containing protein [Clostridiales bacterium]